MTTSVDSVNCPQCGSTMVTYFTPRTGVIRQVHMRKCMNMNCLFEENLNKEENLMAIEDSDTLELTDEVKKPPQVGDPTRFIVVELHPTTHGKDTASTPAFTEVGSAEAEGQAEKIAKEMAAANHGNRYAVYQKRGVAQEVKVVEWKGANGGS